MVMNANGGTITYSIQVDASGAVVGIKNAESKMVDAASASGEKSGGALSKGWAVATGAIAGITSQVFSKVSNVISQNLSRAIGRTDTLNNFSVVMQSVGFSAEESDKSIQSLSDHLDGLPTTLDSAVSNVQILAASMGNLGEGTVNATSVAEAFNDAMLAGGQGTEAASSAFTQYSQMLAVGKVDQMSWNNLVRTAPAQMDQLAKALLGASAGQGDLYKAMQGGIVSFDQFNEALVRLDTEGGNGLASFYDQAVAATGGIQTQLDLVSTSITKVIADALNGDDMSKHLDQLVTRINAVLPKITTAVIQAGTAIVGIIPEILPPIVQALLDSAPILIEGLAQLMVGIAEQLPNLILIILQSLPTIIQNIVAVIPSVVNAIAAALTNPSMLNAILNASLILFMAIVNSLPQIITTLIDALPAIIDNIVTFLTDPANIGMILNAATQLFFALVLAVPQILGSLLGAFGSLVGSLWNGIKSMFGEFAANFGNFIGNIFKGAINGVLSFIEGFINAPIDIINGFIDIINGAFGAIGVNIGKIPRVSLPRLASGGIVESTVGGSVIMAGEGGEDEWVVPESKMASLVDQIQDRIGGGGETINIYVDGVFATSPDERRKVAEDIMDAYNQNQKRRFANA